MPSRPLLAGRYRLECQIAAGGVGEVWRAEDTVLTRTVAVKLLRAELASQAETLARFRAEARHAGALSHPAIARVYDYGDPVPPHPAFLVMELVDGPSLAAVLTAGPLGVAQTMDLVAQVASGLQTAHAAALVHRDIKPGNLLLAADGQVKATDFGIAHVAGSVPVTSTGIVMGTPAYIAPERVSGASATPASDLYSLGVVAYECLAGTAPFTGKPLDVAVAHRDLPLPPFPHAVPAEVARLVGELTAKDPAARPASAGEVAARADRLRGDLTEGAEGAAAWLYSVPGSGADIPPPGPATAPAPALGTPARRARPRRPRRARRIAVAASAAAAVVALAVLALAMAPGPIRGPARAAAPGRTGGPGQPARRRQAEPVRDAKPVAVTRGERATGAGHGGGHRGLADRRAAGPGRERLQILGLAVRVQRHLSRRETGTVLAVEPSGKVHPASTILVTVAFMLDQRGSHDHHRHHHGDGGGTFPVAGTVADTTARRS
ncbi:MAG TPA: serine/threonine-protein kinase [Streptosporangiaceae bacterium]|nr:serine/threonine-protein kinase [Streptosporangiaceae bacterium]